MNTKPTNAIAVYTTFSDDFVRQCQAKNDRYRLKLQLKIEIMFALLKYAYKNIFNVDVDPDELNVRSFIKLKEYGGLYFAYTFGENCVMVAIGKSPLSIGTSSLPLTDGWTPSSELLHVNELKEYEQSGCSVETLCYIWSKKKAYEKLHDIKNTSDNPFDNSFQKDVDSTAGEYSLHQFDFDTYAHYVAVTGKATFCKCNLAKVFKVE